MESILRDIKWSKHTVIMTPEYIKCIANLSLDSDYTLSNLMSALRTHTSKQLLHWNTHMNGLVEKAVCSQRSNSEVGTVTVFVNEIINLLSLSFDGNKNVCWLCKFLAAKSCTWSSKAYCTGM